MCFFFLSSRRRHTRWTGDWSSDVSYSDLPVDRPLKAYRVTFPLAVAGERDEPFRAGANLPDNVELFAFERHAKDPDRKSTRLNSSHPSISYAVFCLKKKKNITTAHVEPIL